MASPTPNEAVTLMSPVVASGIRSRSSLSSGVGQGALGGTPLPVIPNRTESSLPAPSLKPN